MPSPPKALRIALDGDTRATGVDTAAGEIVRLGFRHSIYGSAVEEEFVVEEAGLRLTRLRYGELRLAEFYGHEHARRDGAWWIVEPEPQLHSSITVRVSADSAMRLATSTTVFDLARCTPAGGSVRMSVAPLTQA